MCIAETHNDSKVALLENNKCSSTRLCRCVKFNLCLVSFRVVRLDNEDEGMND